MATNDFASRRSAFEKALTSLFALATAVPKALHGGVLDDAFVSRWGVPATIADALTNFDRACDGKREKMFKQVNKALVQIRAGGPSVPAPKKRRFPARPIRSDRGYRRPAMFV